MALVGPARVWPGLDGQDAWRIWGEAWDASIVKNQQPVASAFADAARRIEASMAG
ncbi:MAG: hypothetical protein HY332_18570 [Chloroflexi bacterium]|nr:hypothetical protein [Chloroflexota bacterium]